MPGSSPIWQCEVNGTGNCRNGKYHCVLNFAKQAHSIFNGLYLLLKNPENIQSTLVIFQNNFHGSSTLLHQPMGGLRLQRQYHRKNQGQTYLAATLLQVCDLDQSPRGATPKHIGGGPSGIASTEHPGVNKSTQPAIYTSALKTDLPSNSSQQKHWSETTTPIVYSPVSISNWMLGQLKLRVIELIDINLIKLKKKVTMKKQQKIPNLQFYQVRALKKKSIIRGR